MYHDFTFEAALASSLRAQWRLDDVLRADQNLDFGCNFLPESLARTDSVPGLSATERRVLNQISANQYICQFAAIEKLILPFLLDHARLGADDDTPRDRALRNFVGEEEKHILLFERFRDAFARGFPVACKTVGPQEVLAARVLDHDPLAVGLFILMVEWMTQAHYLGSIHDEGDIDPLFESLLRHHWMEEAQHARLDTLIVDALAEGRRDDEIDGVISEFVEIVAFIDKSLRNQAVLNIQALQEAIGRPVPDAQRLFVQQHQAARWTYLGSGMAQPRFKATLASISLSAIPRLAACAIGYAAPL